MSRYSPSHALYRAEGLNPSSPVFLPWSTNEYTQGTDIPDLVQYDNVLAIARRLFGNLHPHIHQMPRSDDRRLLGLLVLYVAYAQGEQGSKELADRNIPFALHGLWDSIEHDDPMPVAEETEAEILAHVPSILRRHLPTRIVHEFACHGHSYGSVQWY